VVAYIGKLGALAPFHCPSDIGIESSRPSSEETTGNGRVVEYRAPASRRRWSADIGTATPGQIAGLQSVVQGSKPPWVFVEPYAQVTNMLSPEQSVLDPGSWYGPGFSEGGSAVAADGIFALRTLNHPTGGTVDFGYRKGVTDHPVVVSGVPVTWSAYLRGAGVLAVAFRNSSGGYIGVSETRGYSHGALTRMDITRTPPAGAVSARVWATGATQAALPALSWTPAVGAWAIGRGCNRVTVRGFDEAVQLAVRDQPGLRRSSIRFTAIELG
jgi:hypothetical protein